MSSEDAEDQSLIYHSSTGTEGQSRNLNTSSLQEIQNVGNSPRRLEKKLTDLKQFVKSKNLSLDSEDAEKLTV